MFPVELVPLYFLNQFVSYVYVLKCSGFITNYMLDMNVTVG